MCIDDRETGIPSAHVREVVRRSYKEKVAKMRNRTIIYRTNAEIAFLPPFYSWLISALFRSSTTAGYAYVLPMSTQTRQALISIVPAHIREVVRRSYKEKVAKMRYRTIIYRTNAEIAFLPPFCPDLFMQNPKLGFTSRTHVVIMPISIFGDFRHLS